MPFCPHCGHEIAPLETTCPRCGRQITVIPEVAISYGPPPLRLAGFWLRLLAFAIDLVVAGIASAVLTALLRFPGVITIRDNVVTNIDGRALADRELFAVGVFVLYSAVMLALAGGRTLGGLAAGLRVARADGSRLTFARALGRQLFSIVSWIPAYLGFLWAAWDPHKRTWHDLVAGTRVFHVR